MILSLVCLILFFPLSPSCSPRKFVWVNDAANVDFEIFDDICNDVGDEKYPYPNYMKGIIALHPTPKEREPDEYADIPEKDGERTYTIPAPFIGNLLNAWHPTETPQRSMAVSGYMEFIRECCFDGNNYCSGAMLKYFYNRYRFSGASSTQPLQLLIIISSNILILLFNNLLF